MPHVTHTAEGWQVAAGVVRATLREALDAARATMRAKAAFLRDPDSGDLVGAWRWLPATEEESAPIGGVRIDATAIDEMAASLNDRSTPIPIDGGPAPHGMLASEVHGTAFDSGTPANGWAHAAVSVAGDDGRVELYLWAELLPSVAREIDAGRLAMGSVHFGCERVEEDGAPRGCVLISHALTNTPAVTTIAPANSVRDGISSAWRSRAIAGRVLRGVTPTPPHAAPGERAMPLPDAKIEDEKFPEKNDGKADEKPEEKKREADPDVLAAIDMATGAGVEPSAIAAAILALTEAPKEKPADEPGAEVEAARAAVAHTNRELAALRARNAELEPLAAVQAKRDRDDRISAEATKRNLAPAQIEAVRAHADEHGEKSALSMLAMLSAPPKGSPIPDGAARSRATGAPEAAGRHAQPSEVSRAISVEEQALRAEEPSLSDRQRNKRAMSRAAKKHPHLFSGGAGDSAA